MLGVSAYPREAAASMLIRIRKVPHGDPSHPFDEVPVPDSMRPV